MPMTGLKKRILPTKTSTGVWVMGKSKWAMIAFALVLGGCSHAVGNALPNVKSYSPKFQKELRSELVTVRKCCPRTNQFVKDSVKLRDKVRAGKRITK